MLTVFRTTWMYYVVVLISYNSILSRDRIWFVALLSCLYRGNEFSDCSWEQLLQKVTACTEFAWKCLITSQYSTVNSPSFFKFAKQQAKNHSNCIFVDKVHALLCMSWRPSITWHVPLYRVSALRSKRRKWNRYCKNICLGTWSRCVHSMQSFHWSFILSAFACSSAPTTTSRCRELPTEQNCQLCYVGE